jgi:excisionase family DNA binding protein
MVQTATATDVLTLTEAAEYLRLSEETLARQAAQGVIPGRQIDDAWRFLKLALDDWLSRQDRRALLLQQAGAFADDQSMPALRAAIYKSRRRPEEDDESDASAGY